MRIPDFIADTILRYCEIVREGPWYITGAVSAILGRPTRTYEASLRENAKALAA
jgi:hypothetical protein